MNIRLGFSVLLLFLVESTYSCCDRCWDTCFSNVPEPAFADTYQRIYQIVMGVRSLSAPCSRPKGTFYMIPADIPSGPLGSMNNMKFFTTLAKIVALTHSVDKEENPFFYAKYNHLSGFSGEKFQCIDKCQVAKNFDNRHFQYYQTSSSSITNFNDGFKHAIYLLNNKEMECTKFVSKPLMIVFTGTDLRFDVSTMNSFYNKIVITTPNTNLTTLSKFAYPGLVHQVRNTNAAFSAANTLASCIQKSCCAGDSMVAGKRAATSETFTYTVGDKTGSFTGTFDELKDKLSGGETITTTTRFPIEIPTKPDPTLSKQ